MAGPKFTKEQREWIKTECWTLRVRERLTVRQIAARLGENGFEVSYSQVSRYLKSISNAASKEMADSVEQYRIEVHATLEYVLQQALDQWRKSLEPEQLVSETRREIESRRTNTEGEPEMVGDAEVTTKQQVKEKTGNVAFLREARATLKDLRDLWGMDEASKLDITTKGEQLSKSVKELTDDELAAIIRKSG